MMDDPPRSSSLADAPPRRGPARSGRRAKRGAAGRLRFGRFELDLRARALWAEGRRIWLQHLVFELLLCLLERPGELIGRDELCSRLWADGTIVDFEHGLNTVVRKLRRVLGDSPEDPRYVETVVGRGYRFLGPVEACASARPAAGAESLGVVLVVGEPGLGATLLEEFAERARREGALLLAGRCTQLEAPSPRIPVGGALSARLRAASRPAPGAALLDDPDAGDPDALAVLLHLSGAAKPTPLLILGGKRGAAQRVRQPPAPPAHSTKRP